MESRYLDTAKQLCQLAGAPDLFAYLELSQDASGDAYLEALKKRRRKMQGMQANPKYKEEARFLIKQFSTLQEIGDDLVGYRDSLSESESEEHFPIVEMTIRGVLAAGSLNSQQVAYLRKNAGDLGVSGETFESLLSRIAKEMGIRRPAEVREPWDEQTREDSETDDEPAPVPPVGSPRPRQGPPTVPPGVVTPVVSTSPPPEENTAPPVRARGRNERVLHETPTVSRPRIEILGTPVRQLTVGRASAYELVRFRASGDLKGVRVQTDRPWLLPDRTLIESSPDEQALQVEIDPGQMSGRADQGHLRLLPEKGLPVYIRFEVDKTATRTPLYVAAGLAVVLLVLSYLVMNRWEQATPQQSVLVVEVDPGADSIEIAGHVVGSGQRVVIDNPPLGDVLLEVKQANYQPFAKQIRIDGSGQRTVPVRLVLDTPMDFVPDARDRRAELDQVRVNQLMEPIKAAMNGCLNTQTKVDEPGAVLIHVGRNGLAIGAEFEGSASSDPVIQQCLKRQAARVAVAPFTTGDYGTVRYEYSVNVPDESP